MVGSYFASLGFWGACSEFCCYCLYPFSCNPWSFSFSPPCHKSFQTSDSYLNCKSHTVWSLAARSKAWPHSVFLHTRFLSCLQCTSIPLTSVRIWTMRQLEWPDWKSLGKPSVRDLGRAASGPPGGDFTGPQDDFPTGAEQGDSEKPVLWTQRGARWGSLAQAGLRIPSATRWLTYPRPTPFTAFGNIRNGLPFLRRWRHQIPPGCRPTASKLRSSGGPRPVQAVCGRVSRPGENNGPQRDSPHILQT